MERLFVYSMEHDRMIRLIWQDEDGKLCQANGKVLAWDDRQVTVAVQRPKRTLTLSAEQILSADFRKGDEGEG